jgi:uncharacterized RDD family membrane protein YckC
VSAALTSPPEDAVWPNLVRELLWTADGFPYIAPALLGFIVAASSRKSQRIGDTVANTYVVRAKPRP